jgi:protein-tyrosine phosphatase
MRTRALLVAAALAASTVDADIQKASCDGRTGAYHIDYLASPDAGPVVVYPSSRPDRIEPFAPVTAGGSPVDVSLGRVYFHLKPASGPTRVVADRRLPLEGAANFRDLGGYRTSSGRYVRWGLVYRSNHLVGLTARDYRYLDSLGIRLVCDLRTEGERELSPTKWVGRAPEILSAPVGENRDIQGARERMKQRLLLAANPPDPKSPAAADPLPLTYEKFIVEHVGSYQAVFKRLAAGDLPAVTHCTAGKDRTGVFAAVLLTTLGVPRQTVLEDYALTSQYFLDDEHIEGTEADVQSFMGGDVRPTAAFVKSIMTARPEVLEATFASIDKHYGSFDGFLHDGLKLSEEDLTRLRERLLED